MSDFFQYACEHTTEAVITFEGTEFLSTLLSQAVLGILKLSGEGPADLLLGSLRALGAMEAVDLLIREDQEPFSALELQSLRAMLAHKMRGV